MAERSIPERVVMINIDGLRPDVFEEALQNGKIPNMAGLLGGSSLEKGIRFESVSTAPSITFCCQATIMTGAHPNEHWITGNQYYDRFGNISGEPRHYVYDIGGHRLAFGDTLNVFLNDLASNSINPDLPTLYETADKHGVDSTVVYHMYGRGVTHWIKPDIQDWKFFFTLNESMGISSEKYDERMTQDALQHLQAGHRPGLLSTYYWGLDHTAHINGPSSQYPYLTEFLDPLIGKFITEYREMGLMEGTLFVIFSDHGHREVYEDKVHCLQLRFPPFDLGLGYVFKALERDVLDLPGETNVDTVVSMNGGLAHIYIRPRKGKWTDPPDLEVDTMAVADAFWEGMTTGRYYNGLRNALFMVAVRDTEREGWYAPYRAYTPGGLIPIEEYISEHPDIRAVDPVNRLNALSSPNSGDVLIFSNYEKGFYFSYPYKGIHGGLHPDDSNALLTYGWPTGSKLQIFQMRNTISEAIRKRCRDENGRQVNIADIAHGVKAIMGWL